ncbi:MAG: ribbon-helix-helix domain-containing protein [Promethearchaeota archaeon]
MKIVTVNVPESYIDAINKLIGENGLYPSRSELIRCAVREFLLKELKMANNMLKYKEEQVDDFEEDYDQENFVRVPVKTRNQKNEPIREFKTYKIIKRLEY